MTTSLRESQLDELSQFVVATTGLHFPRARWGDLERQTNLAAQEFGYADAAAFLPWLLSASPSHERIEVLARYLTISETYFWREPQIFDALRRSILPELIRTQEKGEKRLRIWSAGCASGEEVYSIAILLREMILNTAGWQMTLLATDINPHLLRHAARGIYDDWSFRNAPARLKEKYFQQREDGRFEILPTYRHMVTFAPLNLAEDNFPSLLNDTNGLDLIFCRNVLIYFSPERAQQVRQRFYRSLVEGGWLIVAASELSPTKYEQFIPVGFPGAFAYRRAAAAPPAPPPAPEIKLPDQTLAVTRSLRPSPNLPDQTRVVSKTSALPPTLAAPTPPSVVPVPNLPPDLAAAVRDLANQGKLGEALVVCEQAIAANRLDPGLHYLHAIILQEQKREAEAKAAFQRALYLDPSFVLAHFALGNMAQRQGQTRAAHKNYRNTLALLGGFGPDDILPDGDGLTAGRLREVMRAALQTGALPG